MNPLDEHIGLPWITNDCNLDELETKSRFWSSVMLLSLTSSKSNWSRFWIKFRDLRLLFDKINSVSELVDRFIDVILLKLKLIDCNNEWEMFIELFKLFDDKLSIFRFIRSSIPLIEVRFSECIIFNVDKSYMLQSLIIDCKISNEL